jgi:hypothetical protein
MHPLDERYFALGRSGSGDRAEHNERACENRNGENFHV